MVLWGKKRLNAPKRKCRARKGFLIGLNFIRMKSGLHDLESDNSPNMYEQWVKYVEDNNALNLVLQYISFTVPSLLHVSILVHPFYLPVYFFCRRLLT